MKVYLRQCRTGELVGVTYTYPRSGSAAVAGDAGSAGSAGSSFSGGALDGNGGTIIGSAGDGVQILGTEYLSSIQSDQTNLIDGGINAGSTVVGGTNANNENGAIGYYQFVILPFQIPGKFHVVFEAPKGMRITTGSGDYWEVYEENLYDDLFPLMEKPEVKNRNLQNNNDGGGTSSNGGSNSTAAAAAAGITDGNNNTTTNTVLDSNSNNTTTNTIYNNNNNDSNNNNPDSNDINNINNNNTETIDMGPIRHSGYYARSRECFSIQKSPTRFVDIDAGFTLERWPLKPFQYASMVVTVQFYNPDNSRTRRRTRRRTISSESKGGRRNQNQNRNKKNKKERNDNGDGNRKLQGNLLQCREYQKLKGEGVEVEDVWGCEKPLEQQYEFLELTMEQGEQVVNGLQEFLATRLGRGVVLKNVGLAHQKMEVLGQRRRLVLDNDYFGEEEEEDDYDFGNDNEEWSFDLDEDEEIEENQRGWNWLFNGLLGQRRNTIENLSQDDENYRLRGGSFSNIETDHDVVSNRELNVNKEIALLEMGFRIRAEYESMSQTSVDIQDVAIKSIQSGALEFLGILKANQVTAEYFKYAGGVLVRKILAVPEVVEVVEKEVVEVVEPIVIEEGGGLSGFLLIMVISGSVVFTILVGMAAYVWHLKRIRNKDFDSSDGSSSYYSSDEDSSSGSGTRSKSEDDYSVGSEFYSDVGSEFYSDAEEDNSVGSEYYSDKNSSRDDSGTYDNRTNDSSTHGSASAPPSLGELQGQRKVVDRRQLFANTKSTRVSKSQVSARSSMRSKRSEASSYYSSSSSMTPHKKRPLRRLS